MDRHLFERLAQNDISVFDEQSKRHFPASLNIRKAVSNEMQQKVIEELKQNSSLDTFFFVVDTQKHCISQTFGIEKWLGHKDDDFTIDTYINNIHPTQQITRNMFYYHWVENMMSGNFKIEFMKHRLRTLIALMHKNGHYIYLQQTIFVFQHDEQNCLLEYLNYFTVLKDHHDEPYNIHPVNVNGNEMADWGLKVRKGVRDSMLENGFFSAIQKEILLYASENRSKQLNIKDIADGVHKEEGNIKTQGLRIRDKVNACFKTNFTESLAAISFLIQHGLLTLWIYIIHSS